ncbi:MAG: hypothetical protein ACI8T1_001524 [Verrucomicrobiales bacterium]|jgi:hypothetical protein
MHSDCYRKVLIGLVFASVAWLSTPAQAVEVTVQSEFGRERITPRASTITVDTQTALVFDAPEFIYLNRNFEELDDIGNVDNPDDSKVAYYRARIVGPVVNGATVQGTTITGTKLSFVKTIVEDTTVVWKWALEYAVFFEAATTGGAAITGNAFGNPSPVLGRQWVPKNTQFSASVDRTAGADIPGGDDAGFRYSASGYELQNIQTSPAPVPPLNERYWKFGGKDHAPGAGYGEGRPLPFVDSSTTVAWWGKIDRKLDNKRDQVFFQFLNNDTVSFPLRKTLENPDGEWRQRNSMTFGVRPDGQLFAEEITESGASYLELVSLPSALVDLGWHHWAIDFDFPEWVSPPIVSETQTFVLPFPFDEDSQIDIIATDRPEGFFGASPRDLARINVDYTLDAAAQTVTLIDRTLPIGAPGTRSPWIGLTLTVSKKQIRIYRDGVEVANSLELNPIYSVLRAPGLVRPGPNNIFTEYNEVNVGFARYLPASVTDLFGANPLEEELEGGVKDLAVWNGIASKAQRASHAAGDRVGVGSLITSFDFDRRPRYSNTSDPTLLGQQPVFIDVVPFPPEAREVIRTDKGPVPFSAIGNRVATENVIIDDWLRVRTLWEGQVRYRFDAVGGQLENGANDFDGQAFVRYYDEGGSVVEEEVSANGRNTDIWIPLDRRVETGSFYRTFDRCFTLRDFDAEPSGDLQAFGRDLSNYTDTFLIDAQARRRVARVVETTATAPSSVHFVYVPTTFRAEIPLGQSFDALNPNFQLTPPLCEGGVLRTGTIGPDTSGVLTIGQRPNGSGVGSPLRWDQLGSRLLPVQPGTYEVLWPDSIDGSTRYKIEIVSGYPASDVDLSSERELPDGSREGISPDYVRKIRLADVDARFSASPAAHYRHHYDSGDRSPPTQLDPSATDRWSFQELTFADNGTAASADSATSGVPFNSAGSGRSVLLYSFRPNPDEIADGNLADENLAVRVVNSTPVSPIIPDSPMTPLGRRGFLLGGGNARNGVVGIVSRVNFPALLSLGEDFVIDFWLNTKNLKPTDAPVTVLSTGAGKLEVLLDPVNATISANYFGLQSEHPVSIAGSGWTHYTVHVNTESFFATSLTVLGFYADGVLSEDGQLMVPGQNSDFDTSPAFDANGLTLGLGALTDSQLLLDQLRLFDNVPSLDDGYLGQNEVRALRENRVAQLRGNGPSMVFDFESAPSDPGTGVVSFASGGDLTSFGLGPAAGGDEWVRHAIQEVATRLVSPLDDAGFDGSGYILNEISNYNASLYDRSAEVGEWGPVFPVNHGLLFPENSTRRLEIAYYENPFLQDAISHPNVAWPYREVAYDEVVYPTNGPHKDKAIYIASRVGSEGVNRVGGVQKVFRGEEYADLAIYNQPNRNEAGYNPNEEHAIVASGNRAALKLKESGEDLANEAAPAAFALQRDINVTTGNGYTSDPWVLVQATNIVTGGPEMAAYKVFKTRDGAIAFPRPTDAMVSATAGLAYESEPNPEDRFLTMDPTGAYDFSYTFNYPAFAGDLLIPPYPLNLIIGNTAMEDARGKNVQINGRSQRTLWRDVNLNAWIVSGDGRFFHQFFYPFRSDFHLKSTPAVGTPVAWLPDNGTTFTGLGIDLEPVKVVYDTFWRTDYPKLKRGETLTYQGGEFFNENPGSNGLPAVLAMAAAEVVYDSATPSMLLGTGNAVRYALDQTSVRITRPLDRRERDFTTADMEAAGFTPAAVDRIFIVAERWYFKELPGSLQKRIYFDSLEQKLVFRGRLNEKESGDPDLTAGPDPLNILEPNVMTVDEYNRLKFLAGTPEWLAATEAIFFDSQNPEMVNNGVLPSTTNPDYLAGVVNAPSGYSPDLIEFWRSDLSGAASTAFPNFVHLDSFGVGGALVPAPGLLTKNPTESLYCTIVENNRSELDGAPITLHIIEIIPDRYRGAITAIEAADAFSERITLQHNGEFGGNTSDLYYEWWIRDAAPLDVVAEEVLADGSLAETDASERSLWQQYIPEPKVPKTAGELAVLGVTAEEAKHLGLHSIVFEGRPDVILADKLVLMRYRHIDEANWKLVPFEFTNAPVTWRPGTVAPVGPAPFQWAGAANSPQLQADGSKRYIPQLLMGWVKRVLDRINPYEARYNDFFNNESPASYTSQIQIAGPPFAGKVALNSDKNVIENTGLIELYETVLERARELSIDNSTNPVSTDGINQALLLAATRLSVLYELLAREAYSDAQDSTIAVPADSGLASVASYTHAFQNLEPDLLHEELALLRGTDFRKSYPVFNRLFWNYAKGLGEAAYNVNYNIYDTNVDGFIDEDDARTLYPQGHGDAWGHSVRAVRMHYALLQHPNFSWTTRAELYALMDNVLEVDFLDEKTFARLASGKARAGRDIVRATYRLNYTQDPSGQWQGYTDGADPARAWGVSEWAHRTGQAAYFDWAVANALLPDKAAAASPIDDPENLDRLDRLGAIDEIGEIAGGLHEIQMAMDEANGGMNPLGFDSNAITFDINPQVIDGGAGGRKTHFEQIYERAVTASGNAIATLQFATQAGNKLRLIGDDTEETIVESIRQDLDYRNRLIEIFGRPYPGTIGFGKAYPEGYEGPDTLFFAYLDRIKISDIVPQAGNATDTKTVNFNNVYLRGQGIMDNPTMTKLYSQVFDGNGTVPLQQAFKTFLGGNVYQLEPESLNLSIPYDTASNFGFVALEGWGQRTSYGKIQRALEEMLVAEISLDEAVADYIGFLQDWELKTERLLSELRIYEKRVGISGTIKDIRRGFNVALVAFNAAADIATTIERTAGSAQEVALELAPKVNGFSNDLTFAARGTITAATEATAFLGAQGKAVVNALAAASELLRDELIADLEVDIGRLEKVSELEGLIEELANLSGGDQPKRDTIGLALQDLEFGRQDYFTAQAEGFRLLREREAFNKVLASKTQKNRYQDMIFRLTRNEAMAKYQTAFNHASRYVWLAARAYDYETSLDPGNPAAPGEFFNRIIKQRQLGLWSDGKPQAGQGGLAEILNQLNGNFKVLKGQLGIENPQQEIEKISLRRELFRVGMLDSEIQALVDVDPLDRDQLLSPSQRALLATSATQAAIVQASGSDDRWEDALKARIVPDLNRMAEFVRYCRPFSEPEDGPQPGLVIRFSTEINNGVNFFGKALVPGDHKYSTANFATKIRGFGVWLENYNAAGLATTPRAYLVPVGNDYLRTSSATQPTTRLWKIVEQRVPTPFIINQSQLSAPGYIPTLDGVDGQFGQLRRHGDFRMYHDNGDPEADDSELILDTRLISRSVWNSQWLLIIPGASLHADPLTGLTSFAETVSDIRLQFLTYTHEGQ